MTICLLGLGQMGQWLGKIIQKKHPLYLWDIDPQKLRACPWGIPLHQLDEIHMLSPTIVINAVPLNQTIPVFESIMAWLPAKTILADMTSIKRDLADHYRRWGHPFLSFHPLFGPLFRPIDSHEFKTIILISDSSKAGKSWLRELLNDGVYQIKEQDFADHDQAMGFTLGLPFLLSLLSIELLPQQIPLSSGLRAYLGHAQGVLSESDDLIKMVMMQAMSAHLPHQINQIFETWQKSGLGPKDQDKPLEYWRKKIKTLLESY